MGKVFNMVGGGGSVSFSATINVTNATPNEVVTATLLNTATTYSATALADGTATILIGTMGAYNLSCADRYSPSEVSVSQSGATYSARMLTIPNTYQEVEYIESHGTEYIQIGLTFNSIYGFLFDGFLYDTGSTQSNYHLISFYNGSTAFYPIANKVSVWTSTTYEVWWGASNFNNLNYGTIGTTRHTFLYLGSTLKYDNAVVGSSISKNNVAYNILLFARNNQGNVDGKAIARLYSFICYSAENVKSREMIPCYRKSDSVAGLYDVINDVFYDNDGTGTFTVGGDVT